MGSPARRLHAALIGLLIVLTVLGGRLVQLQGLDAKAYAAKAEDQRLRTVTLTAHRGSILDRNGDPLAVTVDARDIYADPKQLVNVATEASTLAPLLHMGVADLETRMSQPGSFVYLARQVTPQVGSAITKANLPGIGVLPSTKRVYPDGDLAASVLGFVNTDGTGIAGLEYLDQKILAGHDGHESFEIGHDGGPIPDGTHVDDPARPGTTIQLTLDSNIQWEAQRAITRQVKATRSDSGTVIVEDPRSGQILALATAPGFDPNDPGAVASGQTGNPAVSDFYEPGSVNKVVTMTGALERHLVTPLTPFVVPNTYTYAGHVFHDAENHGTEHLTLTGVLAKSSNIGTIQVARRLGAAGLNHFLRAYGYGRPTGVGLPGETGGLLPPLKDWSDTTLPTAAFGQGVSVTAMQIAQVYSTIANGGVRVEPSIVRGTLDGAGHLHPRPPAGTHRVISKATAATIRDMLEAVISPEGTAPLAQIHGYVVAGKTGTAQRPDGHGGYSGYTASFVGFAPADKPQLVVEVVLQNPKRGSHFGGTIAAPVFHDVMSFALQAEGIAPTNARRPKMRETWH